MVFIRYSPKITSHIPEKYKCFLRKYEDHSTVKKALTSGNLKIHEKGIDVYDVTFPKDLLSYEKINHIQELEVGKNVIQKNGYDYFTFDAFDILVNQYNYSYFSEKELNDQIYDMFGDDWSLIYELLDYPKVGGFRSTKKIKEYYHDLNSLEFISVNDIISALVHDHSPSNFDYHRVGIGTDTYVWGSTEPYWLEDYGNYNSFVESANGYGEYLNEGISSNNVSIVDFYGNKEDECLFDELEKIEYAALSIVLLNS